MYSLSLSSQVNIIYASPASSDICPGDQRSYRTTINNPDPNQTFTWRVNGRGFFTSCNCNEVDVSGGTIVTIEWNQRGNGSVRVDGFNNGTQFIAIRPETIGSGQSQSISGPSPVTVYQSNNYFANGSFNNLQWHIDSGVGAVNSTTSNGAVANIVFYSTGSQQNGTAKLITVSGNDTQCGTLVFANKMVDVESGYFDDDDSIQGLMRNSTNQTLEEGELLLYPNPVKEGSLTFNVNLSDNSSVSYYEVIDIQGGTITEGDIYDGNNQLDTSILSTGMYTLKITEDEKVITQKFIVE